MTKRPSNCSFCESKDCDDEGYGTWICKNTRQKIEDISICNNLCMNYTEDDIWGLSAHDPNDFTDENGFDISEYLE